ncbi:MAG: TonB-dependent receptor [Flavobacteriales bacterium]|nr:TonB-dependent receptor [Flavobacteriales bacterium]
MKQLLIALLLLTSYSIFAQRPTEEKFEVSGKVIEEGSGTPLEYATVSFTNANNTVVNGGITDLDGNYSIEVPEGVYSIKFEFISYKSKTLTQQRINKDTSIPTVSLALDASSLDEVVVRAETTEVQVRLDKKIYNIGKDLTTSGATVSDALNNVPSVTVDVEGAISLRGNENVRILINGKPSAIAGFGSTDALRQLPAEAIERVEVITSPSARYDAEGTAGILNIILRKEKTLGLNGSVQANIGYPSSSNVSGNINLRTDKFNIFNTTGVRYRDAPGNAFFSNRYFSDTRENPLVTEDRKYERQDQGFNTNLGIEYYLTERSSITASGFLRLGDDEDVTTNETNEFDRQNNLAITRIRTEKETEEDLSYQFSLNYINNFNESGHKLTVDFQYDTDEETENAFIDERNTFPMEEALPAEIVATVEDETEYLAQADYVLPIGENAQFEAGFRANFEETVTDYELYEQFSPNSSFRRNDSLSNIFTYEENVMAAYSQYGNKFGKFSFLLGLRLENTQLKGNVEAADVASETNDELNINFDKNYTGLFPTVNLIYELNERENVTLGYNRRINRPRGYFINPFPSRSSEANVFQGNPDLDPAYSSAFDLGYLKRWDKLTLTSSIYYQYETDSFERIQEDTGQLTPNGIPIIRTIPINLSTNQRYGFEAGVLYNPLEWLRLNGSFNYFKFITEGSFNGVDYGTENDSWFARGSAKVSLPAKIDWQTNAFYRGPRNNAQTETEGLLSINLAFSKDIINDNATIGFNVSDLLNSRKRRSVTETETFRSDSEFQWRERSFTLSFTYRFNQKKQRERSRNDTPGDDDGEFEGRP